MDGDEDDEVSSTNVVAAARVMTNATTIMNTRWAPTQPAAGLDTMAVMGVPLGSMPLGLVRSFRSGTTVDPSELQTPCSAAAASCNPAEGGPGVRDRGRLGGRLAGPTSGLRGSRRAQR